jgi:hypothetical protein
MDWSSALGLTPARLPNGADRYDDAGVYADHACAGQCSRMSLGGAAARRDARFRGRRHDMQA